VANEKISELPAGSPAQPSDAIPIARGGANFSIAVSDIGGGGGGGGINASFGGNTAGVLSLVSSGTLFLAGGNNVTLSQNGNSVTISANTAAAANLSISAGTTTGQFGGVTFGNANNVSFGLNNGTITATASQSNQTDGVYLFGNTTGQSTSNTHDARSLSIVASGLISAGWSGGSILLSAPTLPPLFSGVGVSTGGNTAGITGVQSQQLVLVGGNNVTLSGSAAGGNGTVSINVPSQSAQTVGLYASSQTYGQSSSSTYDARSITFVGQGAVSIGMSGGSVLISGNTNQGVGNIVASGNTTGNSSSTSFALSSLNISGAGIVSVGWVSNSFVISGPASTGISQSMFAASNTTLGTSGTQTIGQISFAGAGNVSVGVSNGSVVISGAGGGGGGGVNFGVSTGGNTAGATGTVSTGNVVLVGSGPISLSQATGAAGSAATITINAPAISSISGTGNLSVAIAGSTISLGANAAAVSIGGNSTSAGAGFSNVSSGTLVLAGGNNITLSQNGASVTISGGAGGGAQLSAGVSTGGNTSGNTGIYSGQVVFAGGNNITLSVSSGAAGAQTITISGANAGGAQTGISGLVVSNTTYTSGTVTFQNANGISFGSSGANGISASYTQSGQAFSAGGGSSTFSTLSFTNGNGVSFTNTAGSVGGIVATTQALFFAGNTTGQSSSSSIADQTVSYSLGGALSGGLSNGSVLLSAPATSSISGTGLVSVVVNASTISIGAAIPQLSFFQPLGPVQNTTVTQNGAGSVQVYPAIAAFPFSASRADIMMSASAAVLAVSTQAQTISMFVGLYSLNASTLTLLSSGSQSYAMTNSSNASNASITGIRRLSVPINVNYTGGFDLFIGQMTNTTFANTNGMSFSNVVVPLGPGQQLQGLIGQVPANSMQFVPGMGLWSTTSAGMPSSMALSAISGAGSGGNAVDNYSPVQFANVTA
jgi:hypothetical protein